MDLPLSAPLSPRLVWMPEAGSTNDVLVQAAGGTDSAAWPELAVVATDNQVAGRGRLGRTWTAPAGRCLAVSVLLRPRMPGGEPIPVERWGVLPLLAGAAMAKAVTSALQSAPQSAEGTPDAADAPAAATASPTPAPAPAAVAVKWPNDVLIGEKKVCGILGELVPGGLVLGAGVNLSLGADELPTPMSTSLTLAGAASGAATADAVLAGYLSELTALYRRWLATGGDAVESGLVAEADDWSATLGRTVRIELPGGTFRTGTARAIDETGRLVVDLLDSADPLVVSAGDVTHLRHSDS